jgi:hypothetical protein
MSRTDPPKIRTSPQDMRGKRFTIRLHGLDQDAVGYSLAGLSDQLEGDPARVATHPGERDLTGKPTATFRALGASGKANGTAIEQAVRVLHQAPAAGRLVINIQSARDLLLTHDPSNAASASTSLPG